MGIMTSRRYAICSKHLGTLGRFGYVTNWGICIAQHGAYFKGLDMYKFQNKTQIPLFHLSDGNRWKIFEGVMVSIEKDLIANNGRWVENNCFKRQFVRHLASPNIAFVAAMMLASLNECKYAKTTLGYFSFWQQFCART